MLLTSVRVSPCSCLWVFCSVGRVTTRVPSSRLMVMSGWRARLSVPFGPLTVTWRPSIVTSTPDGTGMGRRPIRDMSIHLPDEREDFAAQLRLTRLLAGHDPLARADDDDAQAAEDSRDVRLARVDAQVGGRAVLLLADVGDEALVLEDAGDLALGPRRGDDHFRVPCPGRVPDAREHVRDRVGDVHRFPTSSTW